jgi:CheY-like chemotaxis protein
MSDNNIKILIADSDEKNVENVKNALLDKDFNLFDIKEENIFTAKDGLEAFGLIGLHNITYLFSEIDLKHLTGTELIEVLQDIDKINETKIIFMTAKSAEGKIPPLVKKTMFGVISKPLKKDSFKQKIEYFINTKEKELIEAEAKRKKIREDLGRQKEIVTNVINKYLNVHSIEVKPDTLSKAIDMYLSDDEALSDEDLLIIIPTIVGDYCSQNELEHHVENNKLQYIFRNQSIEVKNKKESKKVLFVANILNDSDVKRFSPNSVDVPKCAESAKELKTIKEDEKPKTIIKNRFKNILDGLAKEEKLMEHADSMDYMRASIFLFKAKDMVIDIDFTLDNPKFQEMHDTMKQFRADIDYLNEFRTKKSPEYFFDEIYRKYQPTYLKYRYAANKMFEQRDSNPEYRAIVDKLDKRLQVFKGTGTQMFYNMLIKQLNYTIKSYLNLLNKYAFSYNKLLWQEAKKSKAVKDFFMNKGIEGSVSLKSMLAYYVRIAKLKDKELAKINLLSSMLSSGGSRKIVFLSSNLMEAAQIENYVKKIEPNWQLFTLAKISLIESWFKTNKLPDALIVDYNFSVETKNGVTLMKELENRVDGLNNIYSRMMIFNSISIEDVEEASSVGFREYAKRPFVENEMINKIRFL